MNSESDRAESATLRGNQANPVSLSSFDNHGFVRGKNAGIEALWVLVQALLVSSIIPGSVHRRFLLRFFGAKIGQRVTIKPGVRVKFPWRLRVGDDVWFGEGVWIDNLAEVEIGDDVCLSQGAYLCTGSHDWTLASFDLITKPIKVESYAWIAAKSVIGPGVTVGSGAVLSLASVASSDLEAWTVYRGAPALPIKQRTVKTD